MQKPHMANRALAAIADCEFRGRGCGFVGVRGGGLGTVAAGWWRATGAAAATRPVIEPPGAPTGARWPASHPPCVETPPAHTAPAKC